MTPVTQVILLHRKHHSKMGGKIMRCDQLAAICNRAIGDRYIFTVHSLFNNPGPEREAGILAMKGAIIIGLKGVFQTFTEAELERLKDVALSIGLDYLDMTARRLFRPDFVDFHITASLRGERRMQKFARLSKISTDRIFYLPHHWDPRISRAKQDQSRWSVSYFGRKENSFIPGPVGNLLTEAIYGADSSFSRVIGQMCSTPLHYAVRPEGGIATASMKPFTKGFNAAAAGANVICTSDTTDAEYYLGTDYPYLVHNPSEGNILECLTRAKEEFGGVVWNQALERMNQVRRQTAPMAVGRTMGEILDRSQGR